MITKIQDFNQIKQFYAKHYGSADYLQPSESNPYEYYAYSENGEVLAMMAVELKFNHLAFVWQMVVDSSKKRTGVGSLFFPLVEKELDSRGYKKLIAYVYTTNHPSLFFFIRQGFEVEGRMQHNDQFNSNVYNLGKSLYQIQQKS